MYSDKRGPSGPAFLLFLCGTFSVTQIRVIGSIGISELAIFLCAPFVFLQDFHLLRREGFLTFLNLALLACVGCVISSIVNHTSLPSLLRGFASPYAIWACVVVFRRLLRRNLDNFKWVFLGFAFSVVINVFFFQTAVEADSLAEGANGLEAAEGIASGATFWISRINPWSALPYRGWFLSTPILYSIFVPMAFSVFAMVTTVSGRSTTLATLGGLFVVMFCRKSKSRMQKFSRLVPFFIVLGFMGIGVANFAYRKLAEGGVLGEDARKKYEAQTAKGKDVLHLLMGGRGDVFTGLFAVSDRPIVGFGPWAIDRYGYVEEFLVKYGTPEDLERFAIERRIRERAGRFYSLIPAHSHIVGFWVWYGILGPLIWFYVLYLIYQYYRHYMSAIPQFMGVLAMSFPAVLWNIFFSPFAMRVSISFTLCLLLICRGVAKGRITLPIKMQREINRYCR